MGHFTDRATTRYNLSKLTLMVGTNMMEDLQFVNRSTKDRGWGSYVEAGINPYSVCHVL